MNSLNTRTLDRRITQAFADSLGIPKYSSLLEFFEEGFELTENDRFKKFELEYSPWLRPICGWFDDINTDWIYLIMGSQVSKTTFMMGVLLYISQFVTGAVPALWVGSTQDEAYEFVSRRLKSFLDNSASDAVKKDTWKTQSFRVNNCSLKVGYATNKTSLRTNPYRFVFGDEVGIWKVSLSYVKERLRSFSGINRCGVYATTPPDDINHHSVREMRTGNFYHFYVPCQSCGEFQALSFTNLKWEGKRKSGTWDFAKVRGTARYECKFCSKSFYDAEKLKILNQGKAVCVDADTYERKEEVSSDSKTMQINALYSIMTPFGELATKFITAKAGGVESLKTFLTDELAEIPDNQIGFSLKDNVLKEFVDLGRKCGEIGEGYHLYTMGVDVQRTGKLYFVVLGFRVNTRVSGHVIDYGEIRWKDSKGRYYWHELIKIISKYDNILYGTAIDASDGITQQEVFDFCIQAGRRFVPVIDSGTQQDKYKYKFAGELPSARNKNSYLLKKLMLLRVLLINSSKFKDDFAYALNRDPGSSESWSFPRDCSSQFFTHLANEQRKNIQSSNGTIKNIWQPKYNGAPQHWFSSLIYALALMEDQRLRLNNIIRHNIISQRKQNPPEIIKPTEKAQDTPQTLPLARASSRKRKVRKSRRY